MKAADNYLKQAFAQDFSIRESPVFMLMKSEVEMKGKHWEDAKGTLEAVLKLPQVVDPRPDAMDSGPQQSTFFPFG